LSLPNNCRSVIFALGLTRTEDCDTTTAMPKQEALQLLQTTWWSYAEIGRQAGLCRERIRQLADEYKFCRLSPPPRPIPWNRKRSLLQRFFSKVRFDTKTGCWLWTASLLVTGYGRFYVSNGIKEWYAHRASYRIFRKKKIPSSSEMHHVCFRRNCVNPYHLRVVSHRQNVHLGPNHCALKTHCKRGHPLSGSNVVVSIQLARKRWWVRKRICKTCRRMRDRLRYENAKKSN